MTVKELIEILKELPEDMKVVHSDCEEGISEPSVCTAKESDPYNPSVPEGERDIALIGDSC